MGRPRTLSDEQVMNAVAIAVGRVGPHRLTLRDVAQEAGVSPAMLVQRFGSKRGLLLGFLRAGGALDSMRRAYTVAASPVEGLIDAVVATSGADLSPEEFANHLAFLHLDLSDPEFRAVLAEEEAEVRQELVAYLHAAVEHGELRPVEVRRLAAAVHAIWNGAQIAWAVERDGTLAGALTRDLWTLLGPYLTCSQSGERTV